MNPERWLQVKSVFQEALEIPAMLRSDWLNQQWGSDPDLIASVERLLAHEKSTWNLIDTPPEIPPEFIERLAARPSFEVGQTVADRFVIVRKLGQGGMGEVFEAVDLVAREHVAIKTVLTEMAWDERSHRQLQKEVQLARQVSHPNVCRIHEIFLHRFISRDAEYQLPVLSMELLSGSSLAARFAGKTKLGVSAIKAIALPLADALAAAHRAGVVHGDFKPANIILVPDDLVPGDEPGSEKLRPVVTDFGLARGLAESGPGLQAIRSFIVGTPAYMAPEQFEGGPANRASDVYAFGLVLFELLAGAPAFSPPESIEELRKRDYRAPPRQIKGAEAQLERVVQRCLEHDPGRRFPSAVELCHALTENRDVGRRAFLLVTAGLVLGVGGFASMEFGKKQLRPKPKARSIAVLPFKNSSNEAEVDYIVDGLTDEVRRCVQRIPELRVVAPESSHIADAPRVSYTQLGKQIGVSHILTGSVRVVADRLLTRVEVFACATSLPIMDRSIEREATTAISLEIEIAAAVADALQLSFSEADRRSASEGKTHFPEAYGLYLRANHAMQSRLPLGLEQAGTFYLDALNRDPSFALAWAQLANQRQALSGNPGYAFNDLVPEAERYALKARELSPDLPEALWQLGHVAARYRRDWHEAERLFKEAVRINPNFATGYSDLAGIYTVLNRRDEAKASSIRAVGLDPLSVSAQNNYAYVLRNARLYDEALRESQKALNLNPDFPLAYLLFADICESLGQCERAADMIRRAIKRFGEDPRLTGYLAVALARCGDHSGASEKAAKLEQEWSRKPFFPSVMADIYCRLNERDKMYYWLDVAIREHDSDVASIAVDPSYDRFRRESKFQEILISLNLKNKMA